MAFAGLRRRARALLMDPPRMLQPFFRTARQIRWRRAAWSSHADREFHDQAFAGADYLPFSFSYPGYVTIRRFADLAEPHVPASGRVLDIGCGPGEITCELARRRPDSQFTGIDHSAIAIERARRNAVCLGLRNVSFEQVSAESYSPAARPDLVTMFDSFHHVPEPESFVSRLAGLTDTVFLIEPAGNVLGQWQPHLDLDWVLTELDKVRRRAEQQLGVRRGSPAPQPAAPPVDPAGAAVERRYPISEYERLFTGFGLSVQGTVAGFQQYPPRAFVDEGLKEHFGRFVYETIVRAEHDYIHGKRDLHAKHWAILARRGQPSRLPRFPDPPLHDRSIETVAGPWDVAYLTYEGPRVGRVNERIRAAVTLRNDSWRAWSSSGNAPVHASYHWTSRGDVVVKDGRRSSLGRDLQPGEERRVSLEIELPDRPGAFELQIDLVEEHVTWFSEQDQAPLSVPITVRR